MRIFPSHPTIGTVAHRSIYLLLATGCALAAWRSGCTAVADSSARSSTPKGLRRAISLFPDNASYYWRLAQHEDVSSVERRQAVDQALALNPRLAAAWIEQGLAAEAAGDLERAELELHTAQRIDRTWLPAWTLTNFYFRSNRWEYFWKWARYTAEIPYADVNPVFHLSWRASEDAALILERAITSRRDVRLRYLRFLTGQKRLEAADTVALELSVAPQQEEIELLMEVCDRFLEAGRAEAALRVWNGLAERGLIHHAPLAAGSLTNGDLAHEPASHGFDWRVTGAAGVSFYFRGPPHGWSIALSGKQPEGVDLLQQFVPLLPRMRYRIRLDYGLENLTRKSGLSWSVLPAIGTAPLLDEAPLDPPPVFASADAGLARLVLRYRRPAGETRAEGALVLRRVALEVAREVGHRFLRSRLSMRPTRSMYGVMSGGQN